MGKEIEKLWKSEDYWAMWFAAVLFVGIIIGAVSMVPKVGKWVANPADAFAGDTGLWIAALGIGLGVLMTVGLAVTRENPPGSGCISSTEWLYCSHDLSEHLTAALGCRFCV